MGLETVIDMQSVKERLENITNVIPCEQNVALYAKCLVQVLPSMCNPAGFIDAARETLSQIRKHINKKDDELYMLFWRRGDITAAQLSTYIPTIASAVCPPEFAQTVKDNYRMDEKDRVCLFFWSQAS